MTRRRHILACLVATLLGLAPHSQATGIDEIYEKPEARGVWGSILAAAGIGTFEKSYALVIGISDFDGYPDLPTEADALRMRDYLIEDANFDYVHTLTGDRVSKARIEELMLDEFRSRITENDRFVFYWSGHGVTLEANGGAFGFLPLANSPKDRFSTMVAMDDIARWDNFLPARQVLYLLDSCFAGLAGFAAKADAQDLTKTQLAGPSRHIMTAGTAGEETIAIDALGGSVFTTAVIDGLRGAADAENAFGKDDLVSVGELKEYVATRVEFERRKVGWQKPMTPQLRDLAVNEGAFFFAVPEGQYGARRQAAPDAPDAEAVVAAKGDTTPPDPALQFAQESLAKLGYLAEPATGQMSFETSLAIAAFQLENDLPTTGTLDADTRRAVVTAMLAPTKEAPPDAVDPPDFAPGTVFRDCEACPDMIVVAGGTFEMGGPGITEGPIHTVTVPDFAISRTEITWGDYGHRPEGGFMGAAFDPKAVCFVWEDDARMRRRLFTDIFETSPDPKTPVTCASHEDAQTYTRWLNQQTPEAAYRLPTEAEIEYILATGGAMQTPCGYNGADASSGFAHRNTACADGYSGLAPAGSFDADAHGVYDLAGNAWEWAAECWSEALDPTLTRAGFTGHCIRGSAVVRGASFDDPAENFRASIRQPVPIDRRQANIGFRVVRILGRGSD